MTYVVEIFAHVRQGPVNSSQYDGSWWPGDTRSQGISSHAIDQGKLG